jgi:hypothetical protein
MKKSALTIWIIVLTAALGINLAAQTPTPAPQTKTAPQVEEWSDDFSGEKLDETKWEKFTFEGASGGKLEVTGGEVRIRSTSKTRAGIRSVKTFSGDRFIAEAHVAKVGEAYPEPGSRASNIGFAALTILFDGSGRNRVEWILTSEGTFEAWAIVNGRGERLDERDLGTNVSNPTLGVARRGDEFTFTVNGQEALRKTVGGLGRSFRVMLYGYSSTENDWDAVRVAASASGSQ